MTPPVALTIAGSDSGGGAGIQADLKMFAALGVFGTAAITAVTAQNTLGVQRVDVLPVDAVTAQLDAVVDDLGPAAVKTGMLATAEIVELVAGQAEQGRLPDLVVDPVMVATSGDRLLDADAERAYLDRLLPTATVVTPNLREAAVLVGRPLTTVADMAAAAADLADAGPAHVVVKGGHLDGDAVDVHHDRAEGTTVELRAERIATANVHGTGCSFAAAVTAFLARGLDPTAAIRAAKQRVHTAIADASTWRLGAGQGPVDPLGWGDAEPPPIDLEPHTTDQEHP